MERNLMPPTASEEELNHQGTVLVDRSSKHTPQGHYRSGSTCNETQALVSNDFLNQIQQQHPQQHQNQQQSQLNTSSNLRPITPIPYVQNVVCNTQSASSDEAATKQGKFSSWTGGLRKLFESKKKMTTMGKGDTKRVVCEEEADRRLNTLLGRETQVLLSNPSGVITTVLDSMEIRNHQESEQPAIQCVPVSPASRPTTLSLPHPKSHSSTSKKRLSLECQDLFASTSVDWKLKDPTLRVKTPGDVPASVRRNRGRGTATRFSLYDDRVMGGNCPLVTEMVQSMDFTELEKDGVLEVSIPTMFSSVPYQINTISDDGGVNDSTF